MVTPKQHGITSISTVPQEDHSARSPKTLTVRDAKADLTTAEQRAAELRAAVENDDTTVTPADLAEADQAAEFARLRIKAAAKQEAEQAEADRRARAEQVAAEAAALVDQDDPKDLTAKLRAAVDALAALYATADARHTRLRDMAARVATIRSEAEQAGMKPHELRARYGVAPGIHAGEVNFAVGKDTPTLVRSLPAADIVAAAVALATPAEGYAAEQASSARVNRVRERVPAVAAAFPAP